MPSITKMSVSNSCSDQDHDSVYYASGPVNGLVFSKMVEIFQALPISHSRLTDLLYTESSLLLHKLLKFWL